MITNDIHVFSAALNQKLFLRKVSLVKSWAYIYYFVLKQSARGSQVWFNSRKLTLVPQMFHCFQQD